MTTITRPHGWGVCISPQMVWQHGAWIADQELALLRPTTWLNWNVTPCTSSREAMAGAAFIPMIYGAGMLRKAQAAIPDQPNTTWLLWNEPDRAEQANMTPTQAYMATLAFLRSAWDMGIGWEFQWAAPGVAIDLDGGLDWLTDYVRLLRRHGISRPSYWHIHGYRSASLRQFEAGWATWEQWYAAWGGSAPVVLSEVCAEGASLGVQRAVMDECREMLTRGDVAGVYWYSAHQWQGMWDASALCVVDLDAQTVTLTELGRYWMSLK